MFGISGLFRNRSSWLKCWISLFQSKFASGTYSIRIQNKEKLAFSRAFNSNECSQFHSSFRGPPLSFLASWVVVALNCFNSFLSQIRITIPFFFILKSASLAARLGSCSGKKIEFLNRSCLVLEMDALTSKHQTVDICVCAFFYVPNQPGKEPLEQGQTDRQAELSLINLPSFHERRARVHSLADVRSIAVHTYNRTKTPLIEYSPTERNTTSFYSKNDVELVRNTQNLPINLNCAILSIRHLGKHLDWGRLIFGFCSFLFWAAALNRSKEHQFYILRI